MGHKKDLVGKTAADAFYTNLTKIQPQVIPADACIYEPGKNEYICNRGGKLKYETPEDK